MRKLFCVTIVFMTLQISTAYAQDCTCRIYVEFYKWHSYFFDTYETSRTMQAACELADALGDGYICGCTPPVDPGVMAICPDGGVYHYIGGGVGEWDVKCEHDTDADDLFANCDNCPYDYNPDQSDTEQDDVGDECDNCPDIYNPGQEDCDEDGIGDACEADLDNDRDGLFDNCDNCPMVWNVDQEDCDGDGIGDACETDSDDDGDGVVETCDNCPGISNFDQLDTDHDGIGNACDTVLKGNYEISTKNDITAIAGITEVTGVLKITSSNLTNLSGLEELRAVGYLDINNNDVLTSLNGLGGLNQADRLYINFNASLTSLNGLEGLNQVDALYIAHNASLTSLNGLDNITSVDSNLNIKFNSTLNTLNGLYGVQLIEGPLYIQNNTNLCMETAQVLEDHLRLNGYIGTAYIGGNSGTICPPEISNITTNQGPEGTYIPYEGIPIFSLPSEKLQWVPSDPDALPEPGDEWSWILGIAHSYISFWTYEMSDYSPEVELTFNDDVIGYFGRWKWFSPAAYLPNDGLFWIRLIAEDADGNRSEVIRQVRVDITDTDGDGIPNVLDNCPSICNSGQIDADGDGIGDVCDSDPGCTTCGQISCEQECSACDFVDRFLDNGDGTVTDCRTNLVWLKNANCYDGENWYNSMSAAGELNDGECGLTDGSVEGDWRLPYLDELQGLGTDPPTSWDIGAPTVTFETPVEFFNIIKNGAYWSRNEADEANAYYVLMVVDPIPPPEGYTNAFPKSDVEASSAWLVRDSN